MILLHEEQLFLDSFYLYVQLQPSDICVINELSEPVDVTLHTLAHGRLCLLFDFYVSSSNISIFNL